MVRQLIILGLSFCSGLPLALAKPPTNPTYVVPSLSDEKNKGEQLEAPPEGKSTSIDLKNFETTPDLPPPEKPFLYHLPLRPSATLALSRDYIFNNESSGGWIGLHAAPWVHPTSRIQVGVDIHRTFGWLQAAYHHVPERNYTRFYWGGGVSIMINSKDELRPLLRITSYSLFGAAGWEFQLSNDQNIRAEISLHQSAQETRAKATIGYTILL